MRVRSHVRAAWRRWVRGVRAEPGACPRRPHGSWAQCPCFLPYRSLSFRAPEVLSVRQLPTPVRWAAVTLVTVAASTGCMSIGDDDAGGGRKPAPSRSAEADGGSAAEPDGSTVAGSGRARTGGAEAHSEREADPSTRPSASGVSASAGGAPGAKPDAPAPTRGGGRPLPVTPPGGPQQPQPSLPVEPEPSEPPATHEPEPEPEPSQEPPAPSASPAAEFRSVARRASDPWDPMPTPEVSPQVKPV